METELHEIIHFEVAWVQKVEWLSAYVNARAQAFSSSNILSSFHGSGLIPFSSRKVIRRLLTASNDATTLLCTCATPDLENSSPLDNPQLTSSPIDIIPF